ncbi:MAG: glycine--tRNA ligase [Mycoplasmataceae bacterium]|nr:glycine--tRNA ligase [Mycoplasmataceae bacterium]
MKNNQDDIVNFLKKYGFIFQGSEIYGGLANSWDYGPIGVLLKNNLKSLWWREFVTKNPEAVGLDSAIILNPKVWDASGHLANFSDPLIDCKKCCQRFRADKLIEENVKNASVTEASPLDELKKCIVDNHIKCPACGSQDWTDIRKFNLMFKTFQGVTEDALTTLYLRPETAQGIFINFANVQRTTRMKLPFAVCQIGKAFRNEITPGNFIFRTREFEQMEIEYFCFPEQSSEIFDKEINVIKNFLENILNFDKKNLIFKEHKKEELSHYSSKTIDVQYNFPHGFSELWGIANRTNFDLTTHMKKSGTNLSYLDSNTNNKIVPYVVEPSVGLDRLFYAIVCEKYKNEKIENKNVEEKEETREILKLPFVLSPYKIAILPLMSKHKEDAKKVFLSVIDKNISAILDDSSVSIGKKYRRQDAIGTPFCATFDDSTIKNHTITIRNRDTMKQVSIDIDDLIEFINKNI